MKFTVQDLAKAMGSDIGKTIYLGKQALTFSEDLMVYAYKDNERFDLIGWYTLVQPKPILTEDEKVILRNIKYLQIARNEDGSIKVGDKLTRSKSEWLSFMCCNLVPFNHLFNFITWEDEPYLIEDLLK